MRRRQPAQAAAARFVAASCTQYIARADASRWTDNYAKAAALSGVLRCGVAARAGSDRGAAAIRLVRVAHAGMQPPAVVDPRGVVHLLRLTRLGPGTGGAC